MKVKTLHSERLTLRSYEEADISAWQKWDTDPEVQEYLPEPLNESISYEEQLSYLKECIAEENSMYWSIFWNETGEVIGTVSFNDINSYHGVAELNIIIGEKKYWGKGIATEAIGIILYHARDDLKLRRIMAEFEADNTGVLKAFSQNGFVEECRSIASRMKKGKPIDTMRYYIILR